VVIVAGLIATNNPIIFFGLPSSSRFLLLFSLFLLAITFVMILTSIVMWIRPTKTLPVRIYYSLITLAAVLGIVGIAQLSLFSIF
jgi:hypothetical protein